MMVFVEDHKDEYGVEPICRQLPITPSTYYEHKSRETDPDRHVLLDGIKIASCGEPRLYNLLLKIEMTRNNHRQAAKDAMLGLQNCPNEGNGLWHHLAVVYLLQTGERETAKSILESGLRAFPDNPGLTSLKKLVFI